MKRCPKCAQDKPLDAFAKKRTTRDGLQCWCRDCSAAGRAAWVTADPERARAAGSKWAKENPEANRARVKAWKAENPAHVVARDAAYRAANLDRLREVSAIWRAANADAIRTRKISYAKAQAEPIRERGRRWKQANKGKVLANVKLRKHRKRRASPRWLTRAHKTAMALFYRAAEALSFWTGKPHHVDHIVPLNSPIVCGLHVPWNLQILTAGANLKKSNRF